jgi:hypothetical protein
MTTKNFTQFSTATPLATGDFLVGYNQAGTSELKTTVQQLANAISTNASSDPFIEVVRSPATGSQQRINTTEYLFEWDVKNFETNAAVLSGNPSSYNIVLQQTGVYEIDSRYSAYDISSGDYLLLRLRGDTAPIISFTNNLLELLDVRDPGVNINGIATTQGRTILRVTSAPYYIVISYQGGGGAADGGIGYYTVNENTFGNIPRIRVRKISNL